MTDLPVHLFSGLGGVELAWREVGSGRPFVLLHGLMGSGALLAGHGLVSALAERGYRMILPDLRGHGDSGGPHDPACYPPDILADDMLALIGHLGLDDYDLGGYSMGGKLVLRLLARGAAGSCGRGRSGPGCARCRERPDRRAPADTGCCRRRSRVASRGARGGHRGVDQAQRG